MKRMRKVFSLALVVVLAASGVLWAQSTSAQTLPKPSVPEFTVRYVDHSYDEPAVYGVDPYTGKTVVTQEGYHVQNSSVEVIIKNQAFKSYRNENGSLVWLYYRIAIKGHYEEWDPHYWGSQSIREKIYDMYPGGYFPSDDTGYTKITFGLKGDNGTDTAYKYRELSYNPPPYYGYYCYTLGNVSVGGEVDFRVQAIIGYSTRINVTYAGSPIGLEPGESYRYYIFTGESSDWSTTQTVTIGDNSTTKAPTPSSSQSSSTPTATLPTENPTASSAQPDTQTGILFGFDWQTVAIVVLIVVVGVLAVGMVLLWRRKPAG
jgi:hypothetical protein